MIICSWRNGSSERLCNLLVVWQCSSPFQHFLPAKLFAMTFPSISLSFCLISLLLIKILFLSKQLTKACLLTSNHQVSEEWHSYKKCPRSYCDPFSFYRSRRISWSHILRKLECLATQQDICSSSAKRQAWNNPLTAPVLWRCSERGTRLTLLLEIYSFYKWEPARWLRI